MTTRSAIIAFPAEWVSGPWIHFEIVAQGEPAGPIPEAVIAGGVLEDGTNLLGLVWNGGQRIMRLSPSTRWAIEERFTGDEMIPAEIGGVWRTIVDSFTKANRECRDEGVL